jgi:hypothetical protein
MIIEEQIENLPNPIFKIKKKDEPKSKNPNLPSLFFSCLIVGAKNSGKSYAMTSLLTLFEKNPIYDSNGNELEQRIILFSPTALNESNSVFRNLKNLKEEDIYLEYSDDLLEEILKDIKQHIDEVNEYEKIKIVLDKYKNSKKELTDDEYWIVYNHYNIMPIEEKRHIITHICFDDLIGDTKVFNKSRSSGLVKFLLKHRHLYTNIFITTQYINSIPPVIKSNTDIYCLFKYSNFKDVINKFYPVVSGVLLEEEFEELYKHSTQERFNFLTIMTKGNLTLRRNWNTDLKIKKI